MEEIVTHIESLEPALIYLAVFGLAFIENLLPPSPSDVVVVFAGSLVGLGRVNYFATLGAATLGSCLGFVVMYKIGHWFGARILEQGRIPFIPRESVDKVERWFKRYGYAVIIANRFLAGTRAVVSFFAGLSELSLGKTVLLSFLSSLAWNSILLGVGVSLGKNWQEIGGYLSSYSTIVTVLLVVGVCAAVARFFFKSKVPTEKK